MGEYLSNVKLYLELILFLLGLQLMVLIGIAARLTRDK